MKAFISPALERSYFERASEEQMISYLVENQMVYLPTERWLIAKGPRSVVEELFRQQPLSIENEGILLRVRDEKVIKSYIMHYPLSPVNESLMLELQREELIQFYEETYGKLRNKEGS